jgi:uncharacterized membrane protein
MNIMDFFQTTLILAGFLCSLVAGFLFAYAIVVMPGIKSLSDREFIRAFQVTDRIIQNNQPIFMIVWVGSAVALMISAVLGIERLDGTGVFLIGFATLAYLLGVQLPTIVVNVPLNNTLQNLSSDEMNEKELKLARQNFEQSWNQWNVLRTVVSSLVSVLLIIVLIRI